MPEMFILRCETCRTKWAYERLTDTIGQIRFHINKKNHVNFNITYKPDTDKQPPSKR